MVPEHFQYLTNKNIKNINHWNVQQIKCEEKKEYKQ